MVLDRMALFLMNKGSMSTDFIDAARFLGCSILKPKGTQMEHGFELHKHTLVAESYSRFLQAPL